MENTGRIKRSKKTGKSRYTPVSNEILQSKTLTPEEKSILVHLLSLPEDWVTYKTVIWKDMNMGRDRFDKHWKGLVNKGYIISVKVIKPNGQFAGYDHEIVEQPIHPEYQVTENQGTVIQFMDNTDRLTEIQLTGVQGTESQETESQGVNKVIKEEINKEENNKKESNNDIPKEYYNIGKFCNWKQLEHYIIQNNLEFSYPGQNSKNFFNSLTFQKANLEEQLQMIKNNTKQLQLN